MQIELPAREQNVQVVDQPHGEFVRRLVVTTISGFGGPDEEFVFLGEVHGTAQFIVVMLNDIALQTDGQGVRLGILDLFVISGIAYVKPFLVGKTDRSQFRGIVADDVLAVRIELTHVQGVQIDVFCEDVGHFRVQG